MREITPEHAVLRIKRQRGTWEAVPHTLINDPRPRMDTRGFAAWLMAKPPGWRIRPGNLQYLLKSQVGPGGHIGRDTVRRFLRELEWAGYLLRMRRRSSRGRWIWDIEFSDTPINSQATDFTMGGFTGSGSAVDGATVDGGGVDILHTQIQVRLNKIKLKPTTAESERKSEPVVDMFEIRFPEFLRGQFQRSAQALIESCPSEHRQAVLDEMVGINAKDGIKSPLGLLRTLVERAKIGQFNPSQTTNYRQRRWQESREGKRQLEHRQHQVPTQPVSVSEIGFQVLSGLRERYAMTASENDLSAKKPTP